MCIPYSLSTRSSVRRRGSLLLLLLVFFFGGGGRFWCYRGIFVLRISLSLYLSLSHPQLPKSIQAIKREIILLRMMMMMRTSPPYYVRSSIAFEMEEEKGVEEEFAIENSCWLLSLSPLS